MLPPILEYDHWFEAAPLELMAEDESKRRHQKALARHPDCRDPDHPGCNRCNEEEKDDELETRSTSRR